MRTIFILTLALISLDINAQWEVDAFHAAFRTSAVGIDESTHWTPGEISFWNNPPPYENGATLNDNSLRIFSNLGGGQFDRVSLGANGLSVINGGDWLAFNLGLDATDQGILDLTNGSGLLLSRNVGGIQRQYGSDGSENVYLGFVAGMPGNGYITVQDASSVIQAGCYVDASGNGIVFGDTKSFRVSHPEKEDMDIWYACIEGPEAAIYDRGTASLENGEAFIPFSDHYASMVSNGSTTIQLTPNEWDTYGLAVTKKTDRGFYVKELKGGTGNFSFDWEAKSVRKGKEDFQVLRAKDFLKNFKPVDKGKRPNLKASVRSTNVHKHYAGCVHNQNK